MGASRIMMMDMSDLNEIFPFYITREMSKGPILNWTRVMISVKKELNRLYILGTLITWFASYPAKSSQILKNHSIMLFTSNVNSL